MTSPQLCSDKKLTAGNPRAFAGHADFPLVSIALGSVDGTIAHSECVCHTPFRNAWRCLIGAIAQDWHFHAVIQSNILQLSHPLLLDGSSKAIGFFRESLIKEHESQLYNYN